MNYMLIALLLAARLCSADMIQDMIDHVAAHPSGDTPCSFDRNAFDGDSKALPIGVFDSGIGGLTVLDALLKIDVFNNQSLQPQADGARDFAAEHFIYFGDQANMPYGNYPASGHTDLLRELILRDVIFLLRKGAEKPPVKAIVIACNTATAFGLEDIRRALKSWNLQIPVVGVVEAGARGVMELLPSGTRSDEIAILATVGTCGCEAYPRAIKRATGLAGKPTPVIIQQGCVALAGAIEGDPAFVCSDHKRTTPYQGPKPNETARAVFGITGDELTNVGDHVRNEVCALVEAHRQSGDRTPIGYVMLGCTHYPLVRDEIANAFERVRLYHASSGAQPYAALIRDQLTFINPAEFTAKELFRELARAKLRLKTDDHHATSHDSIFMSVPNRDWPGIKLTAAGALDQSYKHNRALGDFSRNDTKAVPMTPTLLPPTTASSLEHLMPEVWQRIMANAGVSP